MREGGKHKSRSDNGGGLWRATTVPKKIEAEQGVVGYKAGLEYYANGVKSDWLMNEYWIESSSPDDNKKVCLIWFVY